MAGRTLARVRDAFPAFVTSPFRTLLPAGVCLAAGLSLAACGNGSASATSTTVQAPAALLFNAGLSAEEQSGYQQAVTDFTAVLQLQPHSYLAAYDLGVAEYGLKRIPAATTAYRKALSINPNFRSALFNLALLYTSAAPAKATLLFEKLETMDPGDPNVEFNFGLLLEHVGRVKAGETQLAEALKTEPSLKQRLPKGTTLPPGT